MSQSGNKPSSLTGWLNHSYISSFVGFSVEMAYLLALLGLPLNKHTVCRRILFILYPLAHPRKRCETRRYRYWPESRSFSRSWRLTWFITATARTSVVCWMGFCSDRLEEHNKFRSARQAGFSWMGCRCHPSRCIIHERPRLGVLVGRSNSVDLLPVLCSVSNCSFCIV